MMTAASAAPIGVPLVVSSMPAPPVVPVSSFISGSFTLHCKELCNAKLIHFEVQSQALPDVLSRYSRNVEASCIVGVVGCPGQPGMTAQANREERIMPAVTVENLLVLPRVTEPGPEAERPVLSVTTAPSGFEGEGFPVRRAFAGVDLAQLDPFIHMDQMGEVDYAPGEPKGTAWHPHRGFETVTYIIDGTFRHQDSNGGGGLITNGDTPWMTAGGGSLHIEEPPGYLVVSGGLFHGFQLWVNLPAELKMTSPRYQDIRAGQVALLSSADGGALLRVIAGELDGHAGPGS